MLLEGLRATVDKYIYHYSVTTIYREAVSNEMLDFSSWSSQSVDRKYFYINVHPIQGPRISQVRRLMNDVVIRAWEEEMHKEYI